MFSKMEHDCLEDKFEPPKIEQCKNLTEFHKNLTENKKLRTGSEPVTFTLPM